MLQLLFCLCVFIISMCVNDIYGYVCYGVYVEDREICEIIFLVKFRLLGLCDKQFELLSYLVFWFYNLYVYEMVVMMMMINNNGIDY